MDVSFFHAIFQFKNNVSHYISDECKILNQTTFSLSTDNPKLSLQFPKKSLVEFQRAENHICLDEPKIRS